MLLPFHSTLLTAECHPRHQNICIYHYFGNVMLNSYVLQWNIRCMIISWNTFFVSCKKWQFKYSFPYFVVRFCEFNTISHLFRFVIGLWSTLSVGGITVLFHFRKNYPMHVIIYKNDMHLVTLYDVIFSNMTGIL